MNFFRKTVALCVPDGLLFAVAWIVLSGVWVVPGLATAAKVAPPMVAALALLITWRFHRGRFFFAILALAVAERAYTYWGGPAAYQDSVRDLAAMCLSVTFLLLNWLPEKGVWSRSGILRFALVMGQAGLAALLILLGHDTLRTALGYQIVGADTDWAIVGQPALLVSTLAVLALGVDILWRRQALGLGFFWALLAGLSGLVYAQPATPQATLYFVAAGCILIVSAIEAAFSMAYRDELTGLPGRRALNELLDRLSGDYSIAMLDIDFFKKFNDRYGHEAGDQVLRMVAARMLKVSGGGRPFRYGGEEFTIVFSGREKGDAFPHLEDLRQRIGGAGFAIRAGNRPRKKPKKKTKSEARQVKVTVSIGVSDSKGGAVQPGEVVKAADKALYRAKRDGRNRVNG